MGELFFKNIFSFVARYQRPVLWVLGAVIALCALAASRVHFDNDVSAMLPNDPLLRRDLALVRDSAFAGKVVLSFELVGSEASLDDLVHYVDDVAARLPSPLVTNVVKGPSLAPDDMTRFVSFAPRLVDERRLNDFSLRMTSGVINESLHSVRSRLISFQGMFLNGVLRADPLGIFAPELSYLQQLATTFGRHVTFYNGHFATQDGRNLMLILETPVLITDAPRASKLLEYIQDVLKDAPSFSKVDIISGHAHTVANESLIKSDIARTVTVATIAYLVVLICFFRDFRAAIFFLIPAFSVLVALVCCGLMFGKISAFVAALASVIIGVSDDYGILVYTAIRTAGNRQAVSYMMRPIVLAAFFTTGIFAVFFFSNIPGYHQLAFMTIISIWLCVGFVLLIFPHLVTTSPLKLPRGLGEGPVSRKKDIQMVVVWGILVVILGVGACRVHFTSDISALDGVSAKVRASEQRFEDVWLGQRKQGIFVVTAPTLDEALAVNYRVFNDSSAVSKEITSMAPFMLPGGVQEKNLASWRSFWQMEKAQELLRTLKHSAAQQGFSPDAFAAFEGLTRQSSFPAMEDISFLRQMSERFIAHQKDAVQIFTFFPEEPRFSDHFNQLMLRYPGSFIFSRSEFTRRFSSSVNQEAVRLAGYAGLLLLVVAVFFLRNVRLILVVLSAAVTALLAVLGLYGFWGQPLTAPALVALMIAVGLSIDYGVFLLYALKHGEKTGTVKAVGISAATTLTGALSLLAAHHPALFSIGVALSTGLAVGWLCAQIIEPALYRLFCAETLKETHA
ncbi:MAG: MMPL family transporter [Candidatus Omnitrophota bacterium]